MTQTEARQLWNITMLRHRHAFRLVLVDGVLLAVCECGAKLSAAQIEGCLNEMTK